MNSAIVERCTKCGDVLGTFRINVDGEPMHRRCAPVDPRYTIAEMTHALKTIAAGVIDEGGNRRNHPNATQIAREALDLETQ